MLFGAQKINVQVARFLLVSGFKLAVWVFIVSPRRLDCTRGNLRFTIQE